MDEIADLSPRFIAPFNGAVEIGLRALAVLTRAFPRAYSLQRLVVCDYLLIHSDDIPGGPIGLHPQTPHRSGELLVRRNALREGLMLYQSRGLIEERFEKAGVFFAATEGSASFLDSLTSEYVRGLRDRSIWLLGAFGEMPEPDLEAVVREHVGRWGTEFTMESVLWAEERL